MRHHVLLTGDINLLGVTDPTAPFARVQDRFYATENLQPILNEKIIASPRQPLKDALEYYRRVYFSSPPLP